MRHLVYEELWAPPLFEGQTIADVGDRFEGEILGADPQAAWKEAAAAALAPVSSDVLDRTVHLSFGDFPGREYLGQLTADHVIHAWDLARGIGGDERLDPDWWSSSTPSWPPRPSSGGTPASSVPPWTSPTTPISSRSSWPSPAARHSRRSGWSRTPRRDDAEVLRGWQAAAFSGNPGRMPFTIAHCVAARPLERLSGGRLVLPALAVGAMAPDFEYLAHLSATRTIGHTIPGLFILCLPTALVALFLWHRLFGPVLAQLLRPGTGGLTAGWD